jgi:hypothetical protein
VTLLRFINPQGIAGIAIALALAILLVVQKVETRHWKNEGARFEQLYAAEQAALAETVANYREAAATAELQDKANAKRVAVEQRAINERTTNDYEARLAAARSLAQRLRREAAGAAANPRSGPSAAMPALSAAPGAAPAATGEDGLPQPEALIATEQAIQLDELIKWVRAQAAVDTSGHTDVERASESR